MRILSACRLVSSKGTEFSSQLWLYSCQWASLTTLCKNRITSWAITDQDSMWKSIAKQNNTIRTENFDSNMRENSYRVAKLLYSQADRPNLQKLYKIPWHLDIDTHRDFGDWQVTKINVLFHSRQDCSPVLPENMACFTSESFGKLYPLLWGKKKRKKK